MKVTLHEESAVKQKLVVEVGADLIEEHLADAYQEIGKTAKLKGFRPGKVPRKVLEQYYRQDAENKAVRSLIDQTYGEALAEKSLRPLSYPEINIIRFDPAVDLAYEASYEIKPELPEVKGYKGMKLNQDKTDVDEKELKDRLKQYQDYHAKLKPIEKARAMKKGDVIQFDYEALRDGEAFEGNKVNDYTAEIGGGVLLKDFEDQIKDLKVGENKVVEVTLPDDFADKNFAGKKMTYTVNLKEMKQKVVPKLDDEFAKDLGHEDLKIFQDTVRDELIENKKMVNRNKQHRQVVEELVKKNDILVPQAMIDGELGAMFDQLRQNLQGQGQTPEAVGITPEKFREENTPEAKLRVQGMLLFEKIWVDENITVTDEDRDNKIESLANMMRQQKVAVRQYYESNPGQMAQLEAMILQDKTLDFIVDQAKLSTTKSKK